ncbi:MAG: hypothetical protein IPK70_01605 [Flavobacteriales bacterium]|jgi:hypothetical protein|nr:hypothetical protein [Flavobacteriales bacterium]
MRATLALLLSALLIACGQQATEPASSTEQVAPSLAVDLAGHGFPLTVELGDAATLGVDSPSVRWNEDMGQLELRAGERFSILITEEPGDIARLKADLERDQLRTSAIIEEQPDRLIWRSTFPDEDIVFVHFYRIVQAGDRAFVVQDDDRGRFSEADVSRMAAAVRTQQPV